MLTDGTNIQASGIDTAILNLLVNEENVRTDLYNIYYYPELDSNLIFLKILEKNGYFFKTNKEWLRVLNPNLKTTLKANRVDTLYIANLANKSRTEGIRTNKTIIINL